MDSSVAARIFRESGLAEELTPRRELRHRDAVQRVIDVTGAINDRSAAPFRSPQSITWRPADTGGDAAVRAGSAVLIRAFATTAPTTGNATVTITKVTEFSGSDALPVVTIPQGSQFGDVVIAVPVEAGAWFVRSINAANGAAGISVQLVINHGGS